MAQLNNGLKSKKIQNAPQGIVDLFMDLIYNTGSADRAMTIYSKGGVFGLYMALKVKPSDKKDKRNIKSVSNARKDMRLEIIKEELQEENNKNFIDGPLKSKPQKETVEQSITLIKLSTNQYILKIILGQKCYIITDI